MLDKARRLLDRYLNSASRDEPSEDRNAVNLAVAALLIEVLRADFEVTPDEDAQLLESVGAVLELPPEVLATLVETATRQIDEAHDLYQFTSRLNDAFTEGQKLRLLEQLWRVARADSVVHKYEEHLIRRVGELLHLSHSAFITSKLRSERAP